MGRPKKPKPVEVADTKSGTKIGVRTCVPLDDEGRSFFLEQVRKYPCLWNRKHPDFRRPESRNEIWIELAEELQRCNYTIELAPVAKMNNTLTLLKSVYRKKKKLASLTDELLASCKWLRTIDEFLSEDPGPYTYRENEIPGHTNFSLEDNLKLMRFYKENETLWNPKHPMYWNRPLHITLWKNCAGYINKNGITAANCNKMTKLLRRRYIVKRGSLRGPDIPDYCKKMEWFGIFESFLGPLLFPKSQQKKVESKQNQYSNFGLSQEETVVDEELEMMGPIETNLRLLNKSDKYIIYLRFLKLYQKFEILWNPKHPHYGSEFYRENAWKFFTDLIRIEKITPKYCKLKIKTIRAHYIKLRKELTEKELELVFLQPEWFALADSYLGPILFATDSERLLEPLIREQVRKGRATKTKPVSSVQSESDDEDHQLDNEDEDNLPLSTFKVEKTESIEDSFFDENEETTKLEDPDNEFEESIPQYNDTINLNDASRLDETRLRLVTVYKQHELLWNPKHKNYSATPMRSKCWRQYSEQVKIEGMTVEESKLQIRAVRKLYKDMYKKIEKGKETKRQPEWYYVADSYFRPSLNESSKPSKPVKRRPRTKSAVQQNVVVPEFIVLTEFTDITEIKKELPDFTAEPTETCCRACLQDHNNDQSLLKGLNTTIIDGVLLNQIFNDCVGSAYNDADNLLPDSICKPCFHLVVEFYQFRIKCLVNEKKILAAKKIDLKEKFTEINASHTSKPDTQTQSIAFNDADESFMNFEYSAFDDNDDDDDSDDDDSFTWEEKPIVSKKKASPKNEEKPSTSKASARNSEEVIKKEVPTSSKMGEKLEKKIVEIRCGQKRKYCYENTFKEASMKIDEPVVHAEELPTLKEVAEKFIAPIQVSDNFDVGHIDFEELFDNCNASVPIDTSLIVKHDKVITEERINTAVKQKKAPKPAEELEKNESLFADYLKKMLEEAKKNPWKCGKKPKLSHHDTKEPKLFVCPLCGKTATCRNQHMKTHEEPEYLHCKFCNRKQPFQHKLQLEKHMRRVHRDQLKLNRCENCGLFFATREERRNHMQNAHPQVKCDVCFKEYKTPYLMQVHRNSVHVTELNEDGTPLECSQCNKTFRNYTWLNQHRRRVHSQKKFECDECEYSAQTDIQLKRHQYAAHSENAVRFICHICEKSFLHLNYLKRHFMLRHIEKQ